VIVTLSEEEIASETLFTDLGCKMRLEQPFKEQGTVDGIIASHQHPKLTKLQERGIAIFSAPYFVSDVEEEWKGILHVTRCFFEWLRSHHLSIPVILHFRYSCAERDLAIHASAEYGSLFCDGLGEGICLDTPLPLAMRRSLSFAILQGARMRSSKTEFISCPGCGRTLFDLQSVAAKIRERTSHLPGVKIAIMGCIVNGPGEMADADFGYVGSLPGKIDLYIGKERVEKNIPMEEASEHLVTLIKQQGRWIEPE
jgi:(E)-4-hydroxy-3-methylbut-2-enyl-diphosphate synthase